MVQEHFLPLAANNTLQSWELLCGGEDFTVCEDRGTFPECLKAQRLYPSFSSSPQVEKASFNLIHSILWGWFPYKGCGDRV